MCPKSQNRAYARHKRALLTTLVLRFGKAANTVTSVIFGR